MYNLESIFKERVFNKEQNNKIEIIKNNKKTDDDDDENNYSRFRDDLSFDIDGFVDYTTLLDNHDDDFDIDNLTRDDEIGLFKSYKPGEIYADKFNNTYKIIRRNDNSITYVLNSHLGKLKNHEVILSRKLFLERMQYNPSYKQQWT